MYQAGVRMPATILFSCVLYYCKFAVIFRSIFYIMALFKEQQSSHIISCTKRVLGCQRPFLSHVCCTTASLLQYFEYLFYIMALLKERQSSYIISCTMWVLYYCKFAAIFRISVLYFYFHIFEINVLKTPRSSWNRVFTIGLHGF